MPEQLTETPTSALKGVCCHAERATPFRLGCPRRERHFNLCAYLPRYSLRAHFFFFYREFYYRKNSHLASSPRLTHPPLPLLFSSMAHKTPPSPAASTTAYSSSPQSTLSSHQVSRSVALCWRYGPTFISSARRCTPPQVVSNQIRRFVSPCLTSTLAPYVLSLSPVHR